MSSRSFTPTLSGESDVVMNSMLKVTHNTSSRGQHCYCLLRKQNKLAFLTVYMSKKMLTEKQRNSSTVWFVHVLSPSVTVSSENTFTKFVFRIQDGTTTSSFSSKSAYIHDSWVQTLNCCRQCPESEDSTVDITSTCTSYGQELYDHSRGSCSPVRKKASPTKSLLYSLSSSPAEVMMKSAGTRGGALEQQSQRRSSRQQRDVSEKESFLSSPSQRYSGILHSDRDFSSGIAVVESGGGSPVSRRPVTPAQKQLRATRQQFLTRVMSEKETVSAPQQRVVLFPSSGQEVREGRAEAPRTPRRQSSASRQQFLNTLMKEKEKTRCGDDEDDDLDYVPKSTRRLVRDSSDLDGEGDRDGDVFSPRRYSSLQDTPISVAAHLEAPRQQTPRLLVTC